MKISRKTAGYYSLSFSVFAMFSYLSFTFLRFLIWDELIEAVGKLLPLFIFMTMALILLCIAIYLFRKGRQNDKEKQHIRFL